MIHQSGADNNQSPADFVDGEELVFEIHPFRERVKDFRSDGELAGRDERKIELLNDRRGDYFFRNKAELDQCFAEKEVALALFVQCGAKLVVCDQPFGSEQFAQPPFGHSSYSRHCSPRLPAACFPVGPIRLPGRSSSNLQGCASTGRPRRT